ncbi:aminotransferase class V-fold PLP-dependent enzyme [Nannocystaceae bacterium ST9]
MQDGLRTTGESLASRLFEFAKRLPLVKDRIAAEYDKLLVDLRKSAKPYADEFATSSRLPEQGRPHAELLAELEALREREESRWREGFVSGGVYHGEPEHVALLERAYAIHSQTNPLHSDIWPSIAKFEAEIVAMTADMLGAASVGAPDGVCGTVTSGGTESILLAIKTYRDQAKAERGIGRPNMVAPITAHAAFDKAAQYFGVELRKTAIGSDFRADVGAAKRAVDRNTICMIGSAPAFAHGMVDPIEELSNYAKQRGIGFHTDACLGGFVLPWARELGREVPEFDFRLPGVTSISADTHKYGYAAKGTSVLLHRSKAQRKFQWFTITDWPGGMYMSPTIAGSRPGGLSAACWAALNSIGRAGYLDATAKILAAADRVRAGVANIPELELLGDPLWVIAFRSRDPKVDVYRVLDFMSKRHWNLNGLHRPACMHIAITLRHTHEGVIDRMLADLEAAVAHVKAHPSEQGGMAPVYGLAGTLPARGAVRDMLSLYLDALYEV